MIPLTKILTTCILKTTKDSASNIYKLASIKLQPTIK